MSMLTCDIPILKKDTMNNLQYTEMIDLNFAVATGLVKLIFERDAVCAGAAYNRWMRGRDFISCARRPVDQFPVRLVPDRLLPLKEIAEDWGHVKYYVTAFSYRHACAICNASMNVSGIRAVDNYLVLLCIFTQKALILVSCLLRRHLS